MDESRHRMRSEMVATQIVAETSFERQPLPIPQTPRNQGLRLRTNHILERLLKDFNGLCSLLFLALFMITIMLGMAFGFNTY